MTHSYTHPRSQTQNRAEREFGPLSMTDLSITDITTCTDCDGMYDLCASHAEYAVERGYSMNITEPLAREDVPRRPDCYQITPHCRQRQRQRSIPLDEIGEAIRHGGCAPTETPDRFKFVRRFSASEASEDGDAPSKPPRELTVIVRIETQGVEIDERGAHDVLTAYYSEEDLTDLLERR